MSDSGRAVFLSYASQDADAARRICDALRRAGVEVWFDQSELRGGDAWDAKLRKQIKDCALFVPIISANTQARAEGYFRLEWRLADQRTHLMGKSKAFLVPVCIDGTRDADADVPDSFVAVQWTRLPSGEPNAQFCARVQALLEGDAGRGLATPSTRRSETIAAGSGEPALQRSNSKHTSRSLAVAGFVALAIIATAIWRPWRNEEASAAASTTSVAAISTAFPRDPELKRAMEMVNGMEANTEDFALAEEIAKTRWQKTPSLPRP